MSGRDGTAGPGRGEGTPTRGDRRHRREQDVMVPDATFSSYYGRPIVRPAPWGHEIPAYLFLGGLAAGSALLAAGGELTGRPELQRNARLVALGALGGSMVALVADLGRPSRFAHMLRTVKLTSPMSVGSWILTGFGGFTGVAVATEVLTEVLPGRGVAVPGGERGQAVVRGVGRAAGLGAGAFAAPLAAYTAVLLSDTATPTWHAAYRELPFVFVGSALASAGGAALVTTSTPQAGPARRMALVGAGMELAAQAVLDRRIGVEGEPLHTGTAGRLLRASRVATLVGAALTALGGRRRPVAMAAGTALLGGSALTRFGIVEAGLASARDPRYTVIPQRDRLARRAATAAPDSTEQVTRRAVMPLSRLWSPRA